AQIDHHDIILYRAIKELENLSNELINKWTIYSGLLETFSENFDLDKYWHEKIDMLPNISNIALVYIWLPVSEVDVEHSFSAYKRILADNRHA
ncbi:28160_t:CDS:1, partial [Racocetra persica]